MSSTSHTITTHIRDARSDVDAVDRAAREFVDSCRRAREPIVLAVSGGCDSMVLMHAVAQAIAGSHQRGSSSIDVRVATFDHGTGGQASAAAALVEREASALGLEVRVGRGALLGATEAEWRSARWRFFREVAPSGARIATAHTRDDQLETVVMRALRDAGARGLAGIVTRAPGVARPFLHLPRASVRRYGNTRGVSFVEDPSNTSRDHLRNRVRHDLLPAIDRVSPRFGAEMLALAERAGKLRAEVEEAARAFVSEDVEDGVIRVAREQLATYDSATLCVLWPAIAARALVTLDRRGTLRLAQFTTSGAPGARMQLSGRVEVFRHRDSFVVRRMGTQRPTGGETPLVGVVQFGGWRFRPVDVVEDNPKGFVSETPDEGPCVHCEGPWTSELPADRPLLVRAWRPADRMCAQVGGTARRVKRFFGDAKIPGSARAGWPVVVADDEIVWIPGVCRRGAASERSGRPVVRYACERFDGGLSSN